MKNHLIISDNNNLRKPCLYLGVTVVATSLFGDLFAAITNNADMATALNVMKKDVFAYLFPIKIASVVLGAAFSLMKQSLMPFGVGAGITAAIQFFTAITGDADGFVI
jgi:hypothetical protein